MNFTTSPRTPASRGSDNGHSGVRPVAVTGASSLLVVFLVLCFVTLAALTLSTAKADSRDAQLAAEHSSAYYAACNEAEGIAAGIDARLEAAEKTGTQPDFSGMDITEDGKTISYSVRIDERSVIDVELALTPGGPHYFEVARWQTLTDAARTEPTLKLITTGAQP